MKLTAQSAGMIPPAVIVIGLAAWWLAGLFSGDPPTEREDIAVRRIDFSDLQSARFDPITERFHYDVSLEVLDGRRVSITGKMEPYDSMKNFSRFRIVPKSGKLFPNPSDEICVSLRHARSRQKDAGKLLFQPVLVIGTLRLAHHNSDHPAHQAGFFFVIEDATVESPRLLRGLQGVDAKS